jgi:hypothetical protein
MNSEFVTRQSEHLATRVLGSAIPASSDADPTDFRCRLACQIVLARSPLPKETKLVRDFLSRFPALDEKSAWTRLCRALFSSAEFQLLK